MREGVLADFAIFGRPLPTKGVSLEIHAAAIGRDRAKQGVGTLLPQGVEVLDRAFARSPERKLLARKIDVGMLEELLQAPAMLNSAERIACYCCQVVELLAPWRRQLLPQLRNSRHAGGTW